MASEPDENKEVVDFINAHYAEVLHVITANSKFKREHWLKWTLALAAIIIIWALVITIVVAFVIGIIAVL